MGACNFIDFKAAETAREAFDMLVSEAFWEHGHDPYNGTISTCHLKGNPTRVSDTWSEQARELAIQEAEDNGWGEKREARAIDCGFVGDSREHMWAFYGWAACEEGL